MRHPRGNRQCLHERLAAVQPTVVEWTRADGSTAGSIVLRLNRHDAHLVVPVSADADQVTVGPGMAVVSHTGAVTPVTLQTGGVDNTLLLPEYDDEDIDLDLDPVDVVALGLPGVEFKGYALPVSDQGGGLVFDRNGLSQDFTLRLREVIQALG